MLYDLHHIAHNITAIAAISRKKVEYLQLFYQGGTTSEYFADYLSDLITTAKARYPDKQIIFVLDNLSSHKTSLIHQVM